MPLGVRIAVDVPGLIEALARRGIAADPAAVAIVAAAPIPADRPGPVILLVADASAVASALDAGVDDAVPIDADPEEIAARVAARLRVAAPPLGIGELLIDRIARRVTRAGRAISLLPREYALLTHLAMNLGSPVSRRALLEAVWGLRFDPGTNVVAVHISRLRAKIDRDFPQPMLLTEKGMGYRLVPG